MTPQPFTFELGGGQRLQGDYLPGRAPTYLFLHGMGSVRTGEKSTSLLAHATAAGHAYLRVDLRGHGESSGQLGRVAVSEMIADTIRLLEHLGPTVVVGSSLGGLIGAFATVARQELVRGLALLAPALGLVGNLEQRLDAAGRLWTGDGRGFVVDPRVLADGKTLEEWSLPARLDVPTLLVHGNADAVIPWQASERFFAGLRQTRKELWIVPDGDHRLNAAATEIWHRLDRLLGE